MLAVVRGEVPVEVLNFLVAMRCDVSVVAQPKTIVYPPLFLGQTTCIGATHLPK